MRQWGNRYTIHARQQLIDKEFRYLRTVRVTAAVYQGFNSKRKPLLLTFWHRAGVRPYTSSYDLAESCVFIKQSLPPILCHSLKRVPLLPKLRGHFAEFLKLGLLTRLSILYQFTCVGLGYGLVFVTISWKKLINTSKRINLYFFVIHKRSSYTGNIPSATAFALTLGTVLIE